MNLFQLTELSLATISQAILLFFTALYLTLTREKKSITYWLTLSCWSGFFAALFFFLLFSIPNLTPSLASIRWIAYFTLSIVPIPLIQFLYRFPSTPRALQTERRIVFLLSVVASLTLFILTLAGILNLYIPDLIFFQGVLIVEALWGSLLIFRQTLHHHIRLISHLQPSTSYLKLLINHPVSPPLYFQLLAASFLGGAVLVLTGVTLELIPYFAADNLLALSLLIAIPILIFPFLQYSEQDHTLQFIFTGLVLSTVFFIMSLAIFTFSASFKRGYLNPDMIVAPKTIFFERESNQVYTISTQALDLNPNVGEDVTQIVLEKTPIPIGFSFPFFGQNISELYVDPNRAVTFDHPFELDRYTDGLQAGISPLIAPSFIPTPAVSTNQTPESKASQGIFVEREAGLIRITWRQLSTPAGEQWGDVQLELSEDGTITMSFFEPIHDGRYSRNPLSAPWAIGLQSGTRDGDIVRLALKGELPQIETPFARAIIEDYNVAFRQRLHNNLVPFFWITISATILVVTLFPLLIISTISRPIREMVTAINLLKEIRYGREIDPMMVHHNNELGYLQERYNLAVATLSDQMLTTQAEKRALTRKLEDVVVELKESKRDAAKAHKLADMAGELKTQFVTNLSHEIRTPLNAIIGYSDIMIEDALAEGKDTWVSDFNKIKKSAMSLLNMINDILDMSKIESGRVTVYMEAFNIEELLREITEMMGPIAEESKNVFKFDIQATELRMISDYIKVRQIFQNLLGNANKFTQRGVILVRITREKDAQQRHTFSVQVADTGIGMSEEQTNRIFTPFQQADNSISRKYGGSGLGLAITQQLCRILGGQISVKSQLGRGSAFTVKLPVSISSNDLQADFLFNVNGNGSNPDSPLPQLQENKDKDWNLPNRS